jgi:hypothetical protein
VVQNTKGEVVDQLGQLLVEAGMQNVLPLPKARVPVVKFVVGDNGTKVAPCCPFFRLLRQFHMCGRPGCC